MDQKEYERIRQQAWAEYERIEQQAWEEYQRSTTAKENGG